MGKILAESRSIVPEKRREMFFLLEKMKVPGNIFLLEKIYRFPAFLFLELLSVYAQKPHVRTSKSHGKYVARPFSHKACERSGQI